MSKPIQLYAVHEKQDGVQCSHIKTAYNINALFRALNLQPDMNDVNSQRCVEAIKSNGKMFVYLSPEIKKFHFSREALMEELMYYRQQKQLLSAVESLDNT